MKKLLILLLVVALCLPLAVACGDKTPGTTPDGTTAPDGEQDDPGTVLTLTEAGTAKCKIIYPAYDTEAYSAAYTLKSNVAKYLTASFEILDDLEVAANADTLEILVGKTNRPESAEGLKQAYRLRDYFCGVVGNKLVITAPAEEGMTAAIGYFNNAYVVTHKKGSTDTLSVSSSKNRIYIYNYNVEDVTLMGNSIADYSLVYTPNGENIEPLYASLFADHLLTAAGIRLPVKSEQAAGDACEIVFGGTAPAGKFTVKAEGKRLVISASDLLGYEAAYVYLSETLFIGTGANQKKVSVPVGFSYTGDRTSAAEKQAGTYRVMFHNIWGMGDSAHRISRAKELLAFYGAYLPDIIGFNEFWDIFWADNRLAPGLNALGYTEAKPAFLGSNNNCMPIFYRSDVLTLLDVQYIVYENMMSGGKQDVSKGATIALFRTKSDNKEFVVVATHLASAYGCTDSNGKLTDEDGANETEIQKAATQLRLGNIQYLKAGIDAFLAEHGTGLPLFVGGDYNADYTDFDKTPNVNYGISGKNYSTSTLPSGKDYGDYGRAGALLKMQSLGFTHAVDLAEKRTLGCSCHGYPHQDETFGVSMPYPGTVPGYHFYCGIDHTYTLNAAGKITVKHYQICPEYITFGISDHSPQLVDFTLS